MIARAAGPEEEIAEVAETVVAGRDTIAVPDELLCEATSPRSPEPPKSLWVIVREMSVSQRVKLALKGNREARTILLRDPHKMIQRMVLQNPKLTSEEVLIIAKDRNSEDEVLRIVADNKEWTKSYPLRCALAENPRTPVAKALRALATLGDRDIARIAKSKNVAITVAAQARRMYLAKLSKR